MEQPKHAVCPLCQRPLEGAPTTTIVDNAPYTLRRDPPVSVRVHRLCAAIALRPDAGTPGARFERALEV